VTLLSIIRASDSGHQSRSAQLYAFNLLSFPISYIYHFSCPLVLMFCVKTARPYSPRYFVLFLSDLVNQTDCCQKYVSLFSLSFSSILRGEYDTLRCPLDIRSEIRPVCVCMDICIMYVYITVANCAMYIHECNQSIMDKLYLAVGVVVFNGSACCSIGGETPRRLFPAKK
jgi:hypothetical protein